MNIIPLMTGAIGIFLSFAGSVVIALPLLRKSEAENLKKHVQLDAAKPALYGSPDPDDWFDHPVWKAFLVQRKYAQMGLAILGAGITLQITAIFLQVVIG